MAHGSKRGPAWAWLFADFGGRRKCRCEGGPTNKVTTNEAGAVGLGEYHFQECPLHSPLRDDQSLVEWPAR